MSPDRLRAYVTVLTRDVLPPLSGTGMLFYALITRTFEPWMLPLVAGLYGIPLVAPRAGGDT